MSILTSGAFDVTALITLAVIATAVLIRFTASPLGRFHWAARNPASPQHRAPKGPRVIYEDMRAWMREDEHKPARHGGES